VCSTFKNKKKLLFRKFINKYIKLKSKINDEDVFIVGSDQVWNYKITDFDDVFLLNLNEKNIKKYSYAASFGIEKIEDEYLYKYKELLLDFDFITVREHQAYKILKNQMNIESEIVLDPTLLLDASQWSKIFKKNKTENKYILMYLIIKDDKIIDFALQLSKKTGLKIIFISDHIFERVKGIKYLGFISPEKWAYLFYNAEFVVTNSFHGVAFSINFNKNFFVDLLPKALSDVNSRIIDILKLFSLENRLIDKVTMMDNINYKSINDILKQEKQKSLKYLKKIIGCDESV